MIPLSTRMRPRKLDDFLGQKHFFYKGSLLYNSILRGNFGTAIFFGPSGTGKTTLARLIAAQMQDNFVEINASTTGTKELKEVLTRADSQFHGLLAKSTCLYIDEFHRWNKLQQDALLKYLEEGSIRLIGSTTENPFFSINNAILSRVGHIYEFKRLSKEDIVEILQRTLAEETYGLGKLHLPVEEGALSLLAELANGDARVAVDMLGFIAENRSEGSGITRALISEAMQRKIDYYDRGDDRYDLLSALQKSVRGSDPDAAVHYLARLIDGGADVQTVGRRLLVMASEDIGMAYPQAIVVTTACVRAALMTGYPEAVIHLAEATVLLASSPKSNRSYMAYEKALHDIKHSKVDGVPAHLRDSHYSGAKKLNRGNGYLYPHAYGGYVRQQYLPDNLYYAGVKYYEPSTNGQEAAFKKFLEELERKYADHQS